MKQKCQASWFRSKRRFRLSFSSIGAEEREVSRRKKNFASRSNERPVRVVVVLLTVASTSARNMWAKYLEIDRDSLDVFASPQLNYSGCDKNEWIVRPGHTARSISMSREVGLPTFHPGRFSIAYIAYIYAAIHWSRKLAIINETPSLNFQLRLVLHLASFKLLL